MSRRIKDVPINPLLDKRKDGVTMTEAMTIYEQLKEATHLANVIEAAECGYIALDDKSIEALSRQLLFMIGKAERHLEKSSQALQHLRAAKLINLVHRKDEELPVDYTRWKLQRTRRNDAEH